MIHRIKKDFQSVHTIINEAAEAYRNNIPDDCFHEPYMTIKELANEINAGVAFWGWTEADVLVGVMGVQDVKDVTLIRHAYVLPGFQGRGIGKQLLQKLCSEAEKPVLVGTWAAATWAIGLYERNGFRLVTPDEKDRLLSTYWNISPRQKETSVVLTLADGQAA